MPISGPIRGNRADDQRDEHPHRIAEDDGEDDPADESSHDNADNVHGNVPQSIARSSPIVPGRTTRVVARGSAHRVRVTAGSAATGSTFSASAGRRDSERG